MTIEEANKYVGKILRYDGVHDSEVWHYFVYDIEKNDKNEFFLETRCLNAHNYYSIPFSDLAFMNNLSIRESYIEEDICEYLDYMVRHCTCLDDFHETSIPDMLKQFYTDPTPKEGG